MADSESQITEFQHAILDVMMDNPEDVEQIYLAVKDRFPLREVIDEVVLMLRAPCLRFARQHRSLRLYGEAALVAIADASELSEYRKDNPTFRFRGFADTPNLPFRTFEG